MLNIWRDFLTGEETAKNNEHWTKKRVEIDVYLIENRWMNVRNENGEDLNCICQLLSVVRRLALTEIFEQTKGKEVFFSPIVLPSLNCSIAATARSYKSGSFVRSSTANRREMAERAASPPYRA